MPTDAAQRGRDTTAIRQGAPETAAKRNHRIISTCTATGTSKKANRGGARNGQSGYGNVPLVRKKLGEDTEGNLSTALDLVKGCVVVDFWCTWPLIPEGGNQEGASSGKSSARSENINAG